MTPFFSIVIPLYNKEAHIEACIQSVLNQHFTDWELYIINDGSTDSSLSKTKRFESEKVHVILQENKGLSNARNTGIQSSKGAWIAFLDADDLWKPNHLEQLYNLIKTYAEACLVGTNYELFYPSGKKFVHQFELPFEQHGLVDPFFKYSCNANLTVPSSIAVHKTVFQTIGLFDEKITYSEDIDFYIRALTVYFMAYHNEPSCQYRMSDSQQMTQGKLSGKIFPDYEKLLKKNSHIPYLDYYVAFQLYVLAKKAKTQGEMQLFEHVRKAIDLTKLTEKQRNLLKVPSFALQWIQKSKALLRNFGWEFNTYELPKSNNSFKKRG